MSAATTTAPNPALASTEAMLRIVAAVEHFRSTGALPSWAQPQEAR